MVPPIQGNIIKVLVIEDNDDTALFEVKALSAVGFDVERVGDGALAIPAMIKRVPNLAVLDLELPNVTGDEIQRQMCLNPELADIPVVIASVYAGQDVPDPKNLMAKYQYIYSQYKRHPSERIVRKLATGADINDLFIEMTIACGEAYRVIPAGLHQLMEKSGPGAPLPPPIA